MLEENESFCDLGMNKNSSFLAKIESLCDS